MFIASLYFALSLVSCLFCLSSLTIWFTPIGRLDHLQEEYEESTRKNMEGV